MQFAVSVHRESTAYLQFWFEDGKIQICLHLDSLKPMSHVFYLNCDYYYLSILLLLLSKGRIMSRAITGTVTLVLAAMVPWLLPPLLSQSEC